MSAPETGTGELDVFGWPRTPPPPAPRWEVTLFVLTLLLVIECGWLLSRRF
jgi:hypothetical protein